MKTAKQQIIDAFLQLLSEHTFEELYVKDIVHQANISRSTFYLHFTDKHQLMEAVKSRLNDRLLSYYSGQATSHDVTANICRHIFAHRSFYKREFADALAIHQLSEQLTVQLFQTFRDQDYAIFASYGTIGYLSSWVNGDFAVSPAEASEKLLKIGYTNWAENIHARTGRQ